MVWKGLPLIWTKWIVLMTVPATSKKLRKFHNAQWKNEWNGLQNNCRFIFVSYSYEHKSAYTVQRLTHLKAVHSALNVSVPEHYGKCALRSPIIWLLREYWNHGYVFPLPLAILSRFIRLVTITTYSNHLKWRFYNIHLFHNFLVGHVGRLLTTLRLISLIVY